MTEMDIDGISRAKEMSAEEEEEKQEKGIMVILVGAPGSGKSTFCEEVMRLSTRQWVRVCQDTIGNGKTGTKAQCLKSAATALDKGKSVLIDRCNLDKEQRAEFIKLSKSKAHTVVLDLPARLCISRSVSRTGHEGNLQGKKAAAVVNKMLQGKEWPKLEEGFYRITFCYNESEVKSAFKTYGSLGPKDTLQKGVFGEKGSASGSKVQLGIMKFFKKMDPAENDGSNSNSTRNPDKKEFNSNGDDIATLAFPSISTADFQLEHERASEIIVEKVEEFLSKNSGEERARLVFVDLARGSKILSLVREKASKKNIDSDKFFTFVGDITRLRSEGGLKCNVIANAANWRLKPGGGGVNAAIFSSAGPSLETATRERAKSLVPGGTVVVPLPLDSPLLSREGVTHVIHVLGPNMNPQRPNCLDNDYVTGCKILREAYASLFEGFASIVRNLPKRSSKSEIQKVQRDDAHEPDMAKKSEVDFGVVNPSDENFSGSKKSEIQKVQRDNVNEPDRTKKSKVDFDEVNPSGENFYGLKKSEIQKVKSDNVNEPDRTKKSKIDFGVVNPSNENFSASKKFPKVESDNINESDRMKKSKIEIGGVNPRNENSSGPAGKSWGSWAQALYNIAKQPEKHSDIVLEISDDFVVLNDLYPKARKHLLVLTRYEGLNSLEDVRKEHLHLLRTMHEVGLKWAEKFRHEDGSLIFRLGYHSVPSMRQLHLHVVSQDFESQHLKNKKHWNSFTTAFFIDSVDLIEEVNAHGNPKPREGDEKVLKMELRCNRCRSAHPNIPRLKSHVTTCRATFPAELLRVLVGSGKGI